MIQFTWKGEEYFEGINRLLYICRKYLLSYDSLTGEMAWNIRVFYREEDYGGRKSKQAYNHLKRGIIKQGCVTPVFLLDNYGIFINRYPPMT